MARRLNGTPSDSSPRRGPGRPRADASPPSGSVASNVSDETFQEVFLEALGRKKEHEEAVATAKSANAEYRAVLKKAKKLGIMPEVIIIGLADRNLEPTEVERRLAQQNRLYRLLQFKVGTQLSLDQVVEGAPVVGSDAGDAFDAGHDAGAAGKSLASTKYTEESKFWPEVLRGYSQGQRELGSKPGNPTSAAPMEGAQA